MVEVVKSKIKLLIVEDNEADVRLLNAYLNEVAESFKLSSTETVKGAIESLIDVNYDIVLLDLGLPDSSGFETFEKIFKHAENIPIIILTGLNDEELAAKAVSNGAQDYLLKGDLNPEILLKSIKYAIERKKIEIKLRESELKFKTVADFTYDWEYWIDNDGNYLYVSPSCERISGYKIEEFIENPDLLIEITHPDDKNMLIDHHKHSFLSPSIGEIEFRINRKDGSEIWISHNCQPVTNENGDFLGRRASNKDINDRKKAENALKESEHKFRELVENAADSLFVHDFDGNFVDVNKQACESLGYTREELMELNVVDVEQDFDIKSAQKEWLKIKPRDPFTLYGHQKRKDGTVFPVEVRFAAVEMGGQKMFMGLVRDITEKMKAEKNLRQIQQRFEQVAKSAGEWIWEVDSKGTYVYSSPVIKDLLGYEVEELVGKKHFYDLYPVNEKKTLKNSAMELFTNTKPFKGFLNTCVHKDGYTVIMESTGIPLISDTGELRGYIGVDADVSEKYLAQQKLKESEEKYRHVVESAAEGIALIDINGTVIETNPKALEMVGLNQNDVIGQNIVNIAPSIGIDLNELLTSFNNIMNGKQIPKNEWEFVNNNGQKKFVKSHYSPLKKYGKTIGLALVLEDITELKLREKKLEDSLIEKEALLKEIHHRVNNNIQIISSLLNLQTGYVNEETKTVLRDSQSRLKSMAMIHEKLYISNDLSHINIKEYTEKLVSDIFYTYGVRVGTIKSNLNVKDVVLNMETAIPIGLIINELITNSIKYAYPDVKNGTITVELTKNGSDFTLIIADDGVGLPEHIDYQDTVSLGLQLVNNLVKQIDGKITIDKSNGTEFNIKFKELEYKERIEG
jgi:PAS domain S-box-containing protein